MKNFDGLGLNSVLARSLENMKYTTPTPIQAQAIPVALEGRDVLGSAQTGTGKTAAFSIPLVEQLMNSERGTALVMTPTRELGKQVMEVMKEMLGPKSRIKTAFLIGGESMHKQCSQLRQRPRLVVGTPGRINDHLERGNLDLDDTKFLVLDEMDRMLDMGFSIQIDRIVKYMPSKRQTLMFSATMPNSILKMADKYLSNPERISVGSTFNPAKNIKQEIIHVNADKKYPELVNELHARDGSIIIFVKTKRGADKMARKLNDDEFDARPIHGDLQQRKRDRVISEYRNQKFRILVATDVVSRGLDVPHVEHVINYDLPQVPEDYIHRIGRTARAGSSGHSLCLISPQDGRKWHAIESLMDPSKKSARGPARNDNKKKSRYAKDKKFSGGNKFSKGKRDGENRDEEGKYGQYKGKKSFKRNDRDGENRGNGEGRKSFSRDSESRDEKRGNSEGRKFNKDRSFGRDSESRSANKSKPFSSREERGGESRKSFKRDEGKKFNRDNRDGESRGEKRSSNGEGRKFNKDRSFSGEKRNDDARGNSEAKRTNKGGRNFGRDEKRESGEGRKFNKERSFNRDGESRPNNGGDKPFSKKKSYGKDSHPNEGRSFNKTKNFSGGNKGKNFSKGGKPSHGGGPRKSRDAA